MKNKILFFITIVFLISFNNFWFLLAGKLPVMRGVGGNFTAESSLGHKISLSDYKNNIVLLTFGFTNCPDVCPITLGYLHSVFNRLNKEEQKKVKIFFVTVDPIQDTPGHLKKYLGSFYKSFIGISPTQKNLDIITKKYGVKYEEVKNILIPTKFNRPRIKLDDDNMARTFNHSISIFLIDKKNKTRGIYYSGSDSDELIKDIRDLLSEKDVLQTSESNSIIAKNFWIRWRPTTFKVTALYGEIINHSGKIVVLKNVECKSLAGKTALHLSVIEDNMAKMVHQEKITIKSATTLLLKPMSYHVMLMDLKKELEKKKEIDCVLKFANHPQVPITAIIE